MRPMFDQTTNKQKKKYNSNKVALLNIAINFIKKIYEAPHLLCECVCVNRKIMADDNGTHAIGLVTLFLEAVILNLGGCGHSIKFYL